ncbi:hypothetical protein ACFVXG_05310 [Kitasatospora sp. NPDC058162]|uniref:hypothetical protein n=1 Tax=Kitasatospora sp. NPDC058162 TaxID=3346362 RepID=UPI0036DD558F
MAVRESVYEVLGVVVVRKRPLREPGALLFGGRRPGSGAGAGSGPGPGAWSGFGRGPVGGPGGAVPPGGGRPPGARAVGSGGSGARGRRGGRARGAPPQPVAVALAVEAEDFAGLAEYGLFGALGHQEYLVRAEEQLRGLYEQGLEVHLRVLEAGDFEDYCAALGLDPRAPAARVAYAGDPELAGEPFVYAGEPIGDLLPVLLDDHRARVRMSLACASLLHAVGDDLAGQRRMAAVMRYVTSVYLALAEGAGEGCHLLTLRCHGPEDGEQLTSAVDVCVEAGRLLPAGRDVEAFCVTLAAGVASGGEGALLLHGDPSAPPGRPEDRFPGRVPGRSPGESAWPAGALRGTSAGGEGSGPRVRGWALAGGRLRPMTAHEVFDELADDAARGLAFPPGVVPQPGFPLPGFPEAGGGGGPLG